MKVWGADAIEAARGELRIAPGDLVTPLARERAADLGVTIVAAGGSPGQPAPGRPATTPTAVPGAAAGHELQ